MDNKNQYISQVDGSNGGIVNTPQALDMNIGALDMQPESLSAEIDQPASPTTLRRRNFGSRFVSAPWVSFWIIVILVIGVVIVLAARTVRNRQTAANTQSTASITAQFGTQQVQLNGISITQGGGLDVHPSNVVINGQLKLAQGVVIAPSVQPNAPTAGQLYFDQNTNQLAYYNGTTFVPLTAQNQVVESIGGLAGQVTLGGGLAIVGNQLTATNTGTLANGVQSVGGKTGDISVGNGLRLDGTTLQNAGVTSISAGTPNLIVTDDGNGNVVISNVGGGSGTVTSSGGSAGVLPLFTATQNIENSLVSQSGGTVTVGGNLAVSGTLSVGSPISVGNGGTGTNSLTANGLVIGNGSGALTTVTSGGTGLCLLSTVGAPAFGACPSGSGVSSLNGLAGGLTIANATGAVNTITIDDATTGAKGIASFNAANFTVTTGAVNTVQNIGAGASPTFAGLNTNTITPGGTLTVTGATANLLVQGGTGTFGTLSQAGSLVLSDGSSNTATITLTGHAANRNYTIPDTGADANFCLSTGNCVGSGGGAPNDATYLVATLNGTLTNERALTAGTNVSVTDGGANGNMTVATVNNPSFSTSVTTPVLQSSGALTISSAAGTTVALDAGTTIELQDSTNVTGNLDVSGSFTSGAANAFQISAGGAITAATGIVSSGTVTFSGLNCTGNANGGALTTNGSGQLVCSDDDGGSGGAITGSGTSGTVPLFNGTQTITNSIITQSGTTINIAGDLTLSTQLSVANGGTGATSLLSNGVTYGNGSGALQATAAGTGGQVLVANASGVPTFMSISGDVTVSNTGVAAIQANSVALGTDTTGNYVANLGSLTGLSTSGNTGEGSTPTLSVLYGASAGNAVEGNTSLTCTSGTGNLSGGGGSVTLGTGGSCGAVGTVNNPTFSTSVTTPSLIITGAGSNGTLQVASLGQATTYTLPDPGAGTATICLSTGNCAGSGSGVTTTGGTTNRLSKFTGSQSLGDSSLSDNGTVVTVNGSANLVVQGGTGTFGTLSQAGTLAISDGSSNMVSIVASGLAADRTYTLPDVGGPATFCLDTGNCVGGGGGGAPNSAAYLVATLDGTLTNERALAAGSNISVTDGGANGNMTVATVANPSFSTSVTTPVLQSSGALTISSGATTVAIDATTTIELQDSTNVTGNIDISGTFTSGTANAFTISSGGAITAATGITSSGTITFSGLNCTSNVNGGALTTNGSGQLVCSDDDGGSGSAITGSGSSGTVPLFNGTQTLTNSIITQSGTTISIAGDLTLITALSVANGGTGANSFLTNGILYGNNTGAVQVTAAGTSGQVLVADGSGVPTFVSFSGDVVVSNTGATTIQANSVALGTDTTGNYVGTLGSLTGLTTTGNTGEGSTPTLSVTYGSGANTAVQGNVALTCPSGTGNLSGGGTSITLGTGGSCAAIDTVANPNFTTSVTTPLLQSAGAMSITPGGALTIGATGQSFTIQGNGSSVITATNSGFATTVGFIGTATGAVRYNFNQAAAPGTYDICTTAGNCAGGGASFIQGGNSFGATAVLGTNDAHNLELEVNGGTRAVFDQASYNLYLGNGITSATPSGFTVSATGSSAAGTAGSGLTLQGGVGASATTGSAGGDITIAGGNAGGSGNNVGGMVLLQGGSATGTGVTGGVLVKNIGNSTAAFQVQNAANNPVFKVNTTNDVVDVVGQLGIVGTLHITGTTTENYTTPNGASVNARINVANSDPGAFGQIMAMGVTTTANANARVLSLFDGRTVAHQPTLAVLSPNENNIIGLNWNGSNSIGYLMSSDNGGGGSTATIGVRSGATSVGGDSGTLQLQSGDIAGGSGNTSGAVFLVSGNGTGTNASSGTITIDSGAQTGSGTTGAINIGISNAGTLTLGRAAGAIVLNGTTRFSGTATESYVTPIGANVNAKINITNMDPGSNGQIMAMGLVSTADVSSRALSLFDARAVAHSPTLAVLSPNENNIIGLNWNGSDATGYLMTTDTTLGGSTTGISVRSGHVAGGTGDSGTLMLQSGDIAGGTGSSTGAVFLVSGTGTGTNASSGSVTIDSGSKTGAGTNGVISIGVAQSTSLLLGRAAGTVTLQGGTTKLTTVGSSTANAAALCRDTSTTNLISCDANTTGKPFLQGGNSFAAAASLGTNDANNLQFETNNTIRATFDTSNGLYLGNGITAAAPNASTVAGTGSSTAGTAGAALSIQGGAGMTTSTGSAGGNLTLAGGASVGGSGNNAGGIVTLQGGAATNTGTAGYVLVKNTQNSATAFEVADTASAPLVAVDTTARSASGGNLVKIGNSTGTDTALTLLKLDSAASAPTTNLAALNGGLFYNSGNDKVNIIENGVVKALCNTTDLGCGTSTVRLDQIQAATTGATINNANNNIVWNWAMTGTGAGMALGENTAATGGGTQNQSILQIATLSGSTASPLKVTSNSADGGDVVFNLNGNGDIEFQDAGTAFMTLSDAGAVNITLDATDSPAFKVDNLGSGEVGFYQTNGAFRIYDNATIAFAIDSTGNAYIGKAQSGGYVVIGDAVGTPTPDLFVLDNKGTAGDPSTVYTGAMYYNGISNKFRCNQNSAWVDCIQAAGANTSLSNLSSVAINAALGFQSTSAAAINFAAAATTNGNAMNFTGQSAGTTGTGGSFTFTPGAGGSTASGTPGAAGGFTINSATGEAGTGSAVQAGTGSAFSFQGGTGGANASAGGIGGTGGGYSITAGNGGAAASGTAGSGGAVLIRAGDASGSGSTGNGGTITLDPGLGNGGTDGVVQIGNAVADSTGQILVLDNSTSTSDPTGVDGAMYYNASMGVMRCYIDGSWQHCNDPTRLASGYNIQEEFIGEALGSNEGQGWTCGTGTVGMGTTHSWNCNGTGSDSTVAAVAADSYQRPGQLQLTTGTGTTNSIITFLGGSNGKPFVIGGGESFETAINIPTLSNGTQRYIARFGLCDASETHAADCANGVYFEYDSNTSTNWRYATAAASSRTKSSSTKAVATGWTNLKWEATASNNINFYVKSAGDANYTFIGSSSATIPSSTANATRLMYQLDKFAGGTARTFTVDYMDYWNDFTAKR